MTNQSMPGAVVLRNKQGSEAQVIALGATLTSFTIRLSDGEVRDAVLGCASLEDYQRQQGFLGMTVGRFANRIKGARFERDGVEYKVTANQDEHQLHGACDLSHRDWQLQQVADNELLCTIESADGSLGYPGNLTVELRYLLDDDNQLHLDYRAKVDKACPINLTDHSYFNLNPAAADIKQHSVWIGADHYLPVGADGIPPAGLREVSGTSFDFRQSKTIGQDFLTEHDQELVGGYDHSYLIKPELVGCEQPIARVIADDGKLALEVLTTKPAVQLYTGNFVDGNPRREGGEYGKQAGLCLETQYLPDAPNRPDYPHQSCWLEPGQSYQHKTIYKLYQPA
ncbi:galactose-1-epimerase [Aliagarivorans taiwanensis]|uniref:galactose-1-epimerase n=1 Tax=Aliagarivorans taiwanensis TaxID=561966 RepID=UPI00040B6E1F|nr:galactose-1-epimerase [Aliagarivorans taiwanensis]